MSEDRGRGRECHAATVQKRPRGATPSLRLVAATGGATPRPRSGGTTERSHPVSKAGGGSWEKPHRAPGQGRGLGGINPQPRPGVVARRS